MSNSADENPQALVTDDEQDTRSSPTRRVAADQSDLEPRERSQAFIDVQKPFDNTSNSNDLPGIQPWGEDWPPLSVIEGWYVGHVLKKTGGNKQAAARILDVDRKTLDRMIKRHHIEYPHTRQRVKASLTS